VARAQTSAGEPWPRPGSELAVPTDLVRDDRRRRRRAWARKSPSPRPMPGPGTTRPWAWSVDVALIERSRTLRGWTRRELARRARVDPGTLSDLLTHRRRPTFGTVQAICAALGLTLAEVIVFPSG
jgi:DNA-binding Xre family transcriptional regulator